jgi:hypothetical protein
MVAVLASHPQWASMQHAAQQAASGIDADIVYQQRLADIFVGVPAYHALVKLDEAMALLPGWSKAVLTATVSETLGAPTLDAIIETALDGSGSLATRIPTLQLIRSRSEHDLHAPKSPVSLQSYAASAGTAVGTYPSISLDDIIEQIRRGAASQNPKPLSMLFPRSLSMAPEDVSEPPKAAAVAVPAPGFVHAEVAARYANDLLGASKIATSARAQGQLSVLGSVGPDRLVPAAPPLAVPAALPLHEVASHRLDELEAEIQILSTRPALRIAPPQPIVVHEDVVTPISYGDVSWPERSVEPDWDVDEAEIEIVKAPHKSSVVLEPLPELPLRPHRKVEVINTADFNRHDADYAIADANYAFAITEEASVVIVRRNTDGPAAPPGRYAEKQPKTASSSVRRFLKALNGH